MVKSSFILFCSIAALLYFAGCVKKEQKTPLKEFEKLPIEEIVGKQIILNSDTILNRPLSLIVQDSVAIFYDNSQLSGLTMLNLNDGSLIRRFAELGDKATEFNTNALTIDLNYARDNEFVVYQNNVPRRIFTFNIDSIIARGDYRPAYLMEFPKELSLNEVKFLSESKYLGIPSFIAGNQHQFAFFNSQKSQVTTALRLPDPADDYSKKFFSDSTYYAWLLNVLGGELKQRPHHPMEFAYFSYYNGLARVFEVSENGEITLISEKFNGYPKFEVLVSGEISKSKVDNDAVVSSINIATSKDRIYALYSGKKSGLENSHLGSMVLEYDWELNPIRILKLNRECYNLTIDRNNPNLLYVLTGPSNADVFYYDLTVIK
ncbi:hypothetical protein PQ465_04835 [Sphingobacterium oryzagri]|uniref:TolB-like 6-blade propeller-like n=1 Tax=Sphingobacterium oryzagri TaxID=3025669 RepID=A0ABY7WJD6_9SPHI|nr:hypothetical protein [Sphingobacterium sp. KACC 22765]WDF69708.1 hypothetical protein PQ465_04835 [Sphingobacterium sp. KACC 22765]